MSTENYHKSDLGEMPQYGQASAVVPFIAGLHCPRSED